MTTLATYTTAPMTLAEAKSHLIVEHNDDDALISVLINAAANWVFQFCGLICGETTATQYCDGFSATTRLKAWPVKSVSSISYLQSGSNNYGGTVPTNTVRILSSQGAVMFAPVAGWPNNVEDVPLNVAITYVVGASGTLADVAKQAMCLMIAFWYQNREDMPLSGAVHRAVTSLLSPYRQYV